MNRMREETPFFPTTSFLEAELTILSGETDFILISGTHASGKTTALRNLAHRCTTRPLAFISSCHPLFRKQLSDLFLTEASALWTAEGGILFVDEYARHDILELASFITEVKGTMVLSSYPDSTHPILDGKQLGFTKPQAISLTELKPADAQRIWTNFTSLYRREALATSDAWKNLLDTASANMGHYLALVNACMQQPELLSADDLAQYSRLYIARDSLNEKERAHVGHCSYTVAYTDGTSTHYRASHQLSNRGTCET